MIFRTIRKTMFWISIALVILAVLNIDTTMNLLMGMVKAIFKWLWGYVQSSSPSPEELINMFQ